MAVGRHVHDPDIRARFLGRGEHGRHEQFREESVTHVVRPELDLVVFRRVAARDGHDSGIVHQDVESLGFGFDLAGGGGDGLEGGEVEREVGDVC